MAKKKTKTNEKKEKELSKVGFVPNDPPKTPQELEIERLLGLGKVNAKRKD